MFAEKLDLRDRVAVVTGGARGIGESVTAALQEMGARCVIVDVLDEVGTATAARLTEAGGAQVHYVHQDVTDAAGVARTFDAVVAEHGSVDILVTSAGVVIHQPSDEITEADWRHVIDTNVDGTFWCIREAVRVMKQAGNGGAIVAIGSMSGLIVNHPQVQTAYNASKAAVHSLTGSMAVECAPDGIRVNCVAPGYILTDLTRDGVSQEWMREWTSSTPMDRMGSPDEVASVAAFLASDAASFMTGSVVVADGGYTVW